MPHYILTRDQQLAEVKVMRNFLFSDNERA